MLHALWPFLWIWAYYYKPELENKRNDETKRLQSRIDEMQKSIDAMLLTQSNNQLSNTSAPDSSANQQHEKEI